MAYPGKGGSAQRDVGGGIKYVLQGKDMTSNPVLQKGGKVGRLGYLMEMVTYL